MKKGKALVLLLVIALVISSILLAFHFFVGGQRLEKAPNFTLRDIDRNLFNLSDFQGKVVVLDFMATWCGSCKIVENNLKEIYPAYVGEVQIISIDIEPTETDEDLRAYRNENNLPWIMARDVGGNVTSAYGVDQIAKVVIVNKEGYATFSYVGVAIADPAAQKREMQQAIEKALKGEAVPITIQHLSIVGLAVLAAIGSFFSPCSFPLLPGYMTYYLGLNARRKEKGSWKRSISSGFISALGIISVYGIIGIVILSIGNAAKPYVPLLGPIVGSLLIFFGALMLTGIEYHFLTRPFQRLKERLFPKVEDKKERGFYSKLFGYGVGYGAAASGCVAPLFIAAIVNASIYGSLLDGLLVLLLYSLVVLILMLGITSALTVLGQKAVQKVSAYTEIIKKISGIILIVVGAYLLYFYYLAWVATG